MKLTLNSAKYRFPALPDRAAGRHVRDGHLAHSLPHRVGVRRRGGRGGQRLVGFRLANIFYSCANIFTGVVAGGVVGVRTEALRPGPASGCSGPASASWQQIFLCKLGKNRNILMDK